MNTKKRIYLLDDSDCLMQGFRNALVERAKEIGFKPIMPKLPKRKPGQSFNPSVLIGLRKRFANWVHTLSIAEYQHDCDNKRN